MAISGLSGRTSVVLRAYGYVLKQKQIWLQTNGAKGANVVATNSSFGIDCAKCTKEDYPAWNDMYNQMGRYGILSAVAVPNLSIDIDKHGDVPGACSSPYVIATTNTNKKGKKEKQAGWGKINVDIGAPGTDIYSTVAIKYPQAKQKPKNYTHKDYDLMTGTSMATPHVAGAVAFFHSTANQNFYNQFKANPARAALRLKDLMLNSVDPVSDLQGKSVSGGKLNLFKGAKLMRNFSN